MSELIIFGSIGFWAGLIGAIALIIYFLESSLWDDSENSGGGWKATAVVVGFITLYYFFGSREHIKDTISFIGSHTGLIFTLFGAYVVLGVVWAFVKWYFFLLNKRDKLDREIETLYISSTTSASEILKRHIPSAKNNKARIMTWMMYWPFSGLWTLINDPVRRAFHYTYNRVEKFFESISARMFESQKLQLEAKIESRRREEEEREQKRTTRKI